jgi:type I restriction enzyme R subunit
MQQALEYAESLDVPFAFSSNGDGFLEHDRAKKHGAVEREISLDQFSTPEELWARLRKSKGYTSEEEALATQDYYDQPDG